MHDQGGRAGDFLGDPWGRRHCCRKTRDGHLKSSAARVWGRHDDFRLELPYKNIESRLEMLLLW